ncbi:MAG: AtpZ/AtpI family protein [Bacteroidota bacterium]|nr:AtpZ/AtpI family protein [Bacteroidota bacterium]
MEAQDQKKTDPELQESGKKLEEKKEKAQSYSHYSSAGIQIIAIILVGVIAGVLLDKHFETEKPVYTIVLSILMIIVALYQFIRQFLKP